MPATYTEAQRAEALALIQEIGYGQTSKRLGIPASTMRRWCEAVGLRSYAQQNVQQAHEMNAAKNAALRAEIASGLLEDARRLRDQLFAKAKAYNFGGKDNTFNEHELEEPGFRDKQAILTSIGIALDKSLALERHDADGGQGLAAVDEWLRSVMGK